MFRKINKKNKHLSALIMEEIDNVATAICTTTIISNSIVKVRYPNGKSCKIKLKEDIPSFHKFAICNIPKGAYIYKYGYSIGISSKNIIKGSYVHRHNMITQLGAKNDRNNGI